MINGSVIGTLLPLVLKSRPVGVSVDLLLAPLSSGGGKCRYTDYMSRAMFVGERWEINEYAVQQLDFDPMSAGMELQETMASKSKAANPGLTPLSHGSLCTWPPVAYLLYMMATKDNGYQMYSAGLDNYKSGMLQAFQAKFPEAASCNSSAEMLTESNSLEPSFASLCIVKTVVSPFMDTSDPLMQSYSMVYVPSPNVTRVLSWAMDNRVAGKFGYDVDIRLVPLTGCPSSDFQESALKAGPDWRLNDLALQVHA